MKQKIVTRFAPSPTGHLHIGHAYSALMAYNFAKDRGGTFLIRMEDIDTGRCKPEFHQSAIDDLSWLGINSDQPIRIQSQHFDDYQSGLEQLIDKGLAYPCFCTRKDIQREIAASPSAPHGPDGILYPGTCRNLSNRAVEEKMKSVGAWAYRLNVSKAAAGVPTLFWQDELKGTIKAEPESLGDIVIARKDTPTSYHLSVVLDDHIQAMTHIIRGEDLFHATHVHRLLQEILGLKIPLYRHHPLLTDDHGKRFAKRDKAVTLREMRQKGCSPRDIIDIINQRAPTN